MPCALPPRALDRPGEEDRQAGCRFTVKHSPPIDSPLLAPVQIRHYSQVRWRLWVTSGQRVVLMWASCRRRDPRATAAAQRAGSTRWTPPHPSQNSGHTAAIGSTTTAAPAPQHEPNSCRHALGTAVKCQESPPPEGLESRERKQVADRSQPQSRPKPPPHRRIVSDPGRFLHPPSSGSRRSTSNS